MYPYHDEEDDDFDRPPSKTKKKQEMHELQALGEALVDLPKDALKRTLAKLDLSETLTDAIWAAHKMTKQNEAKRRQIQYVGKLMRNIEPAPIREALDALKGASASENAKMHRIEKTRTQLIEDEKTLTKIGDAFPGADLGQLRQLRRNAIKEAEGNKPPKSFRQIYQVLKQLEDDRAAGNADLAKLTALADVEEEEPFPEDEHEQHYSGGDADDGEHYHYDDEEEE